MIGTSNSGEQIIVTYIWKMDEKGYIYLENQALSTVNLPQSFNFSPLLMFDFGSIRRCLAFIGKIYR